VCHKKPQTRVFLRGEEACGQGGAQPPTRKRNSFLNENSLFMRIQSKPKSQTKKKKASSSWHLYILRCSDNSFYTGISTNVKRRFKEHCESPKGAKYTRSHHPVKIVYRKKIGTQGDALKIERLVKRLSKEQKERLVRKERPLPEKRVADKAQSARRTKQE
jgi:putative endonuclease